MKPRAGRRSTTRMRLVGSTAFVLLAGLAPPAAAQAPVGHSVQRLVVPGTAQGEPRPVDVHLWYPADPATVASRPKTVYSSVLHGIPVPAQYDPLSWTVEAELAREGAAIDPERRAVPRDRVLPRQHQRPDRLRAHARADRGRRVRRGRARAHNNTQDDARIDFINTLRRLPPCSTCIDGRPSPCSRLEVPFSMADRVKDISSVLSALGGWFGPRVDTARAGVLGHSRGTLSVLAAAGGSAPPSTGTPCGTDPARCWPLVPDPRDPGRHGPGHRAGADLARRRLQRDQGADPPGRGNARLDVPAGGQRRRHLQDDLERRQAPGLDHERGPPHASTRTTATRCRPRAGSPRTSRRPCSTATPSTGS